MSASVRVLHRWRLVLLAAHAWVGCASTAALERGCRDGVAVDCTRWAALHSEALATGGAARRLEALPTFERACSLGDGRGCLLAAEHLFSLSTRADAPEAARALFTRGCELGDVAACFLLTTMIDSGLGGPSEPSRALSMYSGLCERGLAESCRRRDALAAMLGARKRHKQWASEQGPITTGGLPKAEIGEVIRPASAEVRGCYVAELHSPFRPEPAGRFTVEFGIGFDGSVFDVTLSRPGQERSRFLRTEGCVLTTFRRLRFRPPTGGGEVRVVYPYVFQIQVVEE